MSTSLFGANGVRGVINRDLTPEVALQLGKAVGRTFPGEVAVATDVRDSADAVKIAFLAGMMAVGTDVVDLGVVPTPALQLYMRDNPDMSGGVMITASHNTSEYNGIKMILQDGIEATREDELSLETFFTRSIDPVSPSDHGRMRADDSAIPHYVDAVVSQVDAEAIRAAGLTVCVDCAGGAASLTTPSILKRLGVKVVALGCDTVGAPSRESDPTRENLADLMAVTPVVHADLGVGHDGDGGRSVFVDCDGNYLSGDVSGSIVARSMLGGGKGWVVTPVSSSMVLEDTVESSGGQVRYTGVGSHAIVHRMLESTTILGVEEHGGMIFPEHQFCRDGGMSLAMMLQIVAKEGPLNTLVSSLPKYYTVKHMVFCPDEAKAPLLDWFYKELEGGHYKVDNTDGLKVYCDDGWVLLRASTTEQLFRIYADSSDPQVSEDRVRLVEEKVTDFIGSFTQGPSREQRGPR